MRKNNSTCKICGKGYYVCLGCRTSNVPSWKKFTDTSEHYKIFQVIHGLSTGVYNKSEAKQRLNNIDLSDLTELRENIQKIINDVMSNEKSSTEKKKSVNKKKKISISKKVEV